MEFEFVDATLKHKIKVIGIGGAGNNAVDNMITSGLGGVAFLAANTDLQALERAQAPIKVQLGPNLTKGLGCGMDPEMGRQAALEDEERLKDLLSDADMVFITAGMGGGTGTGGAPIVAEILKKLERPPLTVAVVTKPFQFEGNVRMRQAEDGIRRLQEYADTIITIPNQRLLTMAPRGCNIKDAFKLADNVLLQAVKGVSDLILLPGYINVDFKDAERVMSSRGQALMGTGLGSGPDRATKAAQEAISSPLLEDVSIHGARGLLINISSAENNVTLEEINEACSLIQKEADPEAIIIFGVAWDNTLDESLRITVIATGIGQKTKEKDKDKDKVKVQPKPEKSMAGSIDEANRMTRHFDKPTSERREKKVARSLSEFERPQYTKYEHFIHDEENLDLPTFMRRKAD